MLYLDGSQGEGGGQILRTALTLSAISGIPFTLTNIRAGRKTPGLRPQHMTAIQAAADICQAEVDGVIIGSDMLVFTPTSAPLARSYEWDIQTAGAATLVLQTVLLPLALADGESSLQVHGGTHVPHSPSAHYLRDVYLPVLLSMGIDVQLFIEVCGWVPQGGGTLNVFIAGNAQPTGLDMRQRGQVERVFGTAIGCNLPSHIPQRMANRATNLLTMVEVPIDVRPTRTRSISTGAGIFLAVEYANGRGGFGALGRKGVPSEAVAEQAVTALLHFHDSEAAVDEHLADQLIVAMVLAQGQSTLSTTTISRHLRTNIDVVRAFAERPIDIDERRRLVTIGE
ncbi:MAG: RNA 3'-terminal phosphate cyclase [Chloroflexi bacterium]|nr:RNA 3'-terminal phosphate cyclase [Chloroflexota bacterium]